MCRLALEPYVCVCVWLTAADKKLLYYGLLSPIWGWRKCQLAAQHHTRQALENRTGGTSTAAEPDHSGAARRLSAEKLSPGTVLTPMDHGLQPSNEPACLGLRTGLRERGFWNTETSVFPLKGWILLIKNKCSFSPFFGHQCSHLLCRFWFLASGETHKAASHREPRKLIRIRRCLVQRTQRAPGHWECTQYRFGTNIPWKLGKEQLKKPTAMSYRIQDEALEAAASHLLLIKSKRLDLAAITDENKDPAGYERELFLLCDSSAEESSAGQICPSVTFPMTSDDQAFHFKLTRACRFCLCCHSVTCSKFGFGSLCFSSEFQGKLSLQLEDSRQGMNGTSQKPSAVMAAAKISRDVCQSRLKEHHCERQNSLILRKTAYLSHVVEFRTHLLLAKDMRDRIWSLADSFVPHQVSEDAGGTSYEWRVTASVLKLIPLITRWDGS